MSFNAASLKLMADKGLSAHDIAEIAAAAEQSSDSAADRRRAWDRERKRLLRDGGYFDARDALFESGDLVCRYCGSCYGPFHADHIIPLARGGSSDRSNLTIACARCNLDKGAKRPEEWAQ